MADKLPDSAFQGDDPYAADLPWADKIQKTQEWVKNHLTPDSKRGIPSSIPQLLEMLGGKALGQVGESAVGLIPQKAAQLAIPPPEGGNFKNWFKDLENNAKLMQESGIKSPYNGSGSAAQHESIIQKLHAGEKSVEEEINALPDHERVLIREAAVRAGIKALPRNLYYNYETQKWIDPDRIMSKKNQP